MEAKHGLSIGTKGVRKYCLGIVSPKSLKRLTIYIILFNTPHMRPQLARGETNKTKLHLAYKQQGVYTAQTQRGETNVRGKIRNQDLVKHEL